MPEPIRNETNRIAAEERLKELENELRLENDNRFNALAGKDYDDSNVEKVSESFSKSKRPTETLLRCFATDRSPCLIFSQSLIASNE